MVERIGALGYFGDARRAAVGTELMERVTASGSLVIRKLGATCAGELAIHRFLSAPSVICKEMLGTLAGRTRAATSGRRIVVAQDTTEINFLRKVESRPESSAGLWPFLAEVGDESNVMRPRTASCQISTEIGTGGGGAGAYQSISDTPDAPGMTVKCSRSGRRRSALPVFWKDMAMPGRSGNSTVLFNNS